MDITFTFSNSTLTMGGITLSVLVGGGSSTPVPGNAGLSAKLIFSFPRGGIICSEELVAIGKVRKK